MDEESGESGRTGGSERGAATYVSEWESGSLKFKILYTVQSQLITCTWMFFVLMFYGESSPIE